MGILNLDVIKQAREKMETQSANSNIGFAKLKQGKNVVRVLFPKGDRKLFYSEGYVHYGLGAEGKNMVTCPKTFNEHTRCPICEYAEQLQKSKDKNDQTLGSKMRRKKRVYINIIDRDDESEVDVPKVLPVGTTVLRSMLDVICDPDYGDITHPTEGRDVTITKKGQGLKTEYTVIAKPSTTPVSSTLTVEELEEQMADLDRLFKEQSYSELVDMLNDDEGGENDTPEKDGESASESEGSGDYDDMEVDELKSLCEQRGIAIPEKVSKLKLIMYLTQYDDDQGSDEVMGVIGNAIESRKKK